MLLQSPLPREIWLYIIRLLSPNHLLKVRQLSRQLRQAILQKVASFQRRKCDLYVQRLTSGFKIYVTHSRKASFDDEPATFLLSLPEGSIVKFVGVHSVCIEVFSGSISAACIHVYGDAKLLAWVLQREIFRFMHFSTVSLYVEHDDLDVIAPFLPTETMTLAMKRHSDAKSLLKALEFLPNLEELDLRCNAAVVDRDFFVESRIRTLRRFCFSRLRRTGDTPISFSDELLLTQTWLSLSFLTLNEISVNGLNELVRQWVTGKRVIINYKIFVHECQEFLGGLQANFEGVECFQFDEYDFLYKVRRQIDKTTLEVRSRRSYVLSFTGVNSQ